MNELETSGQEIAFSVLVISYNHEAFITKALDSILEQEFPYKVEIVIGVDKCPDNTDLVCREYKQLHPDELIVLTAHQENIGMYANFCDTLSKCRGKYIAILEGDDYWIDKRKLHKQYQYFEKHPSCILNGGFAIVVDEQGNSIKKPKSGFLLGQRFFKEDLLLANRFSTLTVAFRSGRINWDNIHLLKGTPHLDWPFYLSLNFKDDDYAYLFNEAFGAYRQHGGGLYSLVQEEKKLFNTARTVLAIEKITRDSDQQLYLKSLFVNLLRDKDKINSEQDIFKYFAPSLIIYNKGWIKSSFLIKVSMDAIRYLLKGKKNRFSFKSKVELIRQTKTSKRIYFQLLVNPFIILGLVKIHSNNT